MLTVASATAGLFAGSWPGALLAAAVVQAFTRFHRLPREPIPPTRLVLILLLVELRSGNSVLAALMGVSRALPGYRQLRHVVRVARLDGLLSAIELADAGLRPILAQLVRAQHTGASAADAVRRQLEDGLATDRAKRIESARSVPVKLMIPMTLLMLPGMVLLIYGPSLLHMFGDLSGLFG